MAKASRMSTSRWPCAAASAVTTAGVPSYTTPHTADGFPRTTASIATTGGPFASDDANSKPGPLCTIAQTTSTKGRSKWTTSTTTPTTTPVFQPSAYGSDPMTQAPRHLVLLSGPLAAGSSSRVAASPGTVRCLVSGSVPPGGSDISQWSPGFAPLPAAAPTWSPACTPHALSMVAGYSRPKSLAPQRVKSDSSFYSQ
ncbi:UNVERIFIED_CONTAM: hypothetical protein FKN15_023120 [Acipenser sinensis]